MTAEQPVVIRGVLGWGNRKSGLEAYGPGGRWSDDTPPSDYGDLLGDALERAGATEGATLLVVAVPRFGDTSILDHLARVVAERPDRPTPNTDTPDPLALVAELRDAVGLFSGAMPITPKQAWDEAVDVARRAVQERDAYEAAPTGEDSDHE